MSKEKKGVIYTCITCGYDKIRDHSYINPEWDYICFADNLSIEEVDSLSWKFKNLNFCELDNIRNQRWHKLHPHILFPEYQYSIWVDGNIDILNKNFFNDIEDAINKDKKMSIAIHPERQCIYDELDACLHFGKDDPDVMQRQINLIKNDNFPKNNGLFETNIIFREHKNRDIVKIMDDWWWWIKNYSRRDQLSLTYVLWKNNYKVLPLNKKTYRGSDSVNFVFDENHITKEELILQKNNLKKDLDFKNRFIEEKNKEIEEKNKEIEEKNKEIELIKSSKFWKIRNFYIYFKSGIIFLILHPERFIKKIIKKPVVSVIIPVYDRVEELKESIESILSQTYKNIELILVTDGSPKETLSVLDKYKNNKKIKIFYYKDNTGNAVRGRNRGIKEAMGEFIAFQDSDDIADKNRIMLSLKYMDKYGADLVYGGWRAMVDGSRLDTGLKNGQEIISPDCDMNTLLNICVPCQSTVMVRKDALIDVGGLKDKMEYREDHELWLRLMYFGYKFKSIPKILTNLRIHIGNNELNFKDNDKKWKSFLEKEYRLKQNFKDIKNI